MAENLITVKMLSDNSEEVIKEMKDKLEKAFASIGAEAEGNAKENCPHDTGRLRNSIAWATSSRSGGGDNPKQKPEENTVYIGTNVEYAIYVEFGTGKFADGGGGRQTPWWYQGKDGKWHYTVGMKPYHYLRDAMTDHIEHYKDILRAALDT